MVIQEYRRFTTVVGATGNPWRFQMYDPATGSPLDLTGYTSAILTAKAPGAAANTVDGEACTIEAGTSGWVSYSPVAADVDTAGELFARVTLDPGDGTTVISERVVVDVEEF